MLLLLFSQILRTLRKFAISISTFLSLGLLLFSLFERSLFFVNVVVVVVFVVAPRSLSTTAVDIVDQRLLALAAVLRPELLTKRVSEVSKCSVLFARDIADCVHLQL